MGCFNAWLHWKATQAFHDHWICVIKCNFRIILCFQVLQWNQSVLLQRHFPGFRGFTNSLCSVCRETGLLHCCQQSQGIMEYPEVEGPTGIIDPAPGSAQTSRRSRPVHPWERCPGVPGSLAALGMSPSPGELFQCPTTLGGGKTFS